MIIGQRGVGFCTLAADTRRRDHVTQALCRVSKVHKLSDQLLLAQGGAGTGATDEVVAAVKANSATSSMNIHECARTVSQIAPAFMEIVKSNWQSRGLTMPPTFVVLASVDKKSGLGIHKGINLLDGTESDFIDAGPYFTGVSTNLIQQKASEEWHRRMAGSTKTLAFDSFAVSVAALVEQEKPQDVGLPVDVGIVRFSSEGFECALLEGVENVTQSDSRFVLDLRIKP